MTYKLSNNKLNKYQHCKRCFWLQENKIVKKSGGDIPFPSLPRGIDRVLKEYFDEHREAGTVPEELAGIGSITLYNNKENLRVWRNNWKGLRWETKEGHTLTGAVDDILERKRKLIVLDYKTKGQPIKKGDALDYYQQQLNIYTFLLQKNGFETEDFGYLAVYRPHEVLGREKGMTSIGFPVTLVKKPVEPLATQDIFFEAIKLLEQKEMPAAGKRCGYCNWVKTMSTIDDKLAKRS